MKTLVAVDPALGYGLGLYSIETQCGPVWGHDGFVPGYLTIAWNDESGDRGFVLGLPTLPDEAIGDALAAVVDVASCRMFGLPVPTDATASTTVAPVPLPLVDRPANALAR